MVILSVDISIDIAIAISQSVQTQKVVINTLVYLVYGYYNSSTIKDRDRACISPNLGRLLSFGIAVNGNFVFNVIRNITLSNTVFVLAVCGLHFFSLYFSIALSSNPVYNFLFLTHFALIHIYRISGSKGTSTSTSTSICITLFLIVFYIFGHSS